MTLSQIVQELENLGFENVSEARLVYRKDDQWAVVSIFPLPDGYRISCHDNDEYKESVFVRDLDMKTIRKVLPEWLILS